MTVQNYLATPGTSTMLPNLRWPGGRNVAVVLNIAYETWSEGKVSGVGPMGNPLPGGKFDTNADAYGRYGANAGIQRLMRKLDRVNVVCDVLFSAALAERETSQVKAIADAGHGIVGHGYTQDRILATLSPEEELDDIRRSAELLAEVAGKRPRGWMSPRATPGPNTKRHLVELGYDWIGDSIDADLPTLEVFKQGRLISIPFSTELNDLSHSMRFGRTPGQFVELFDDVVSHNLADRNDTVIIDVLAHTHCYGRPAGAWAFEEIARKATARDDIWLTTRDQIADHFLNEINRSTGT